MQWKLHVRFGGRAGETHQPKGRQGAPVRPLHLMGASVVHRTLLVERLAGAH